MPETLRSSVFSLAVDGATFQACFTASSPCNPPAPHALSVTPRMTPSTNRDMA